MVLGAVRCPLEKSREIAVRLREIKVRHKLSPDFELQWGRVSKGQASYYEEARVNQYEFRFAWQNAVWHLYEPVSFDLIDPNSIQERAVRWYGRRSRRQARGRSVAHTGFGQVAHNGFLRR